MVILISLTKTLTATANNGGPSTWTNPNQFPEISSGSWATEGYSGSKTIEIHAESVKTQIKASYVYIDKPKSKSTAITKPSETMLIDFKRKRKQFIITGWLADTSTVNAVEQYFILLAMIQEGGNVTMRYRGADYTQMVFDELLCIDEYEIISQTADTTYQMDTDATYSKPDEAKIKVQINLTHAFERGA